MIVSRCISNLPVIFKQYKKETGAKNFDLNKIIQWIGDRQCIEIDDNLI